jgi:ATP-dependent Lon protease
MAWTPTGDGDVLFIEATKVPGKGELQLTGSLGDVIKESAEIGLSWVKAQSFELGITPDPMSLLLKDLDVHIHFPAGAVGKDGPSAGITITTALVSLFRHQTIAPHTAMTGEITLRGDVLPVGGIKEKLLAAHRVGIRRVIIPEQNVKDLQEVPHTVKSDLKIIPVRRMRQVLDAAFDTAAFTDTASKKSPSML